mmetsp:Transcript_42944/g.31361  ORF Transcript_42944/g.31361 Transcript_42944/m.31361 type:complete len:141 (+) Transcript_42944:181-603(+)|eukprot:CAMPEP_0202966326 /NCGR_PEP_ID=MMETSP1396-20130829/10686_1 /ASSEMBLY_ACC=CAM_ASM_000872 /TAXON_ID= /ORGANISM="Pseudokeronopsis sp., Strain Brazil" /LENGTH=140 /DNA_ID=CAMNT_0049690043 /DNA_START=2283 /DNA_END=2705 /DNA_ORIENTATION=+
MTNLPFTLLGLILLGDQYYYDVLLTLLILNKICLSFTGGMVRAHFAYPEFKKNHHKLDSFFGLGDGSDEFSDVRRSRSGSVVSNPRVPSDEEEEEEEKRLDSRSSLMEMNEEIKEEERLSPNKGRNGNSYGINESFADDY